MTDSGRADDDRMTDSGRTDDDRMTDRSGRPDGRAVDNFRQWKASHPLHLAMRSKNDQIDGNAMTNNGNCC